MFCLYIIFFKVELHIIFFRLFFFPFPVSRAIVCVWLWLNNFFDKEVTDLCTTLLSKNFPFCSSFSLHYCCCCWWFFYKFIAAIEWKFTSYFLHFLRFFFILLIWFLLKLKQQTIVFWWGAKVADLWRRHFGLVKRSFGGCSLIYLFVLMFVFYLIIKRKEMMKGKLKKFFCFKNVCRCVETVLLI